jgi:uncharacterized MAPEG superfamily protein
MAEKKLLSSIVHNRRHFMLAWCVALALVCFIVITRMASLTRFAYFLRNTEPISVMHARNVAASRAYRNRGNSFESTVYIIGTSKKVDPRFIAGLSKNLALLTALWKHSRVIIYCDEVSERSFRAFNDTRFTFIRENFKSPLRTHRIAYGRNTLLQSVDHSIISNHDDRQNTFLAVIDLDKVSHFEFNRTVIEEAMAQQSQWDSVSFNRHGYYDFWALRYSRYDFNLWARNNTKSLIKQMDRDIEDDLRRAPTDFLPVYSAFNGFALYKYNYTVGCKYNGSNALGDDFKGEDCEHVQFHKCMIQRNGARIRIFRRSLLL